MAATECDNEAGNNFIRFVGGVCSGEEVEGEYVGDDVTSGKCYNYGCVSIIILTLDSICWHLP